jgi:hypothetical protein
MKNLLTASLLLAGCAADNNSPFIDGFDPPAPKSDEIQIVAPAARNIQPGEDITLCAYIDDRVATDTDIVAYHGYQSIVGGHHVILYSVHQQQAANVHECTEDDMINVRYLAGSGADSPPAELPENVVFRIPGNTQLMVQTHWINATDQPIDGQGAFNLKVTAPKPEHQTAQLFTVVNTLFEVPVGNGHKAATECTVNQAMNVFTMGAHMHEWGTHASITHTPANSTGNMIYDHGWTAEDVFDPPRNNYPTSAPLRLAVGDKIKVDCTYNNTTGAALPFPSEMCVAWHYAYPLTEELNCTDGNWPR